MEGPSWKYPSNCVTFFCCLQECDAMPDRQQESGKGRLAKRREKKRSPDPDQNEVDVRRG